MMINHHITVIDFIEKERSIYIQVEVFDAETGQYFREEVRFLDDLLYGELVHPIKSPLSKPCRLVTVDYLRKHFER